MNKLLIENVLQAFLAIKSQGLRTLLTILIIAFGIMALVGILSAIDVINYGINKNFATMGANTFNIRNKGSNIRIGRPGKRTLPFENITFKQASDFKSNFERDDLVGISMVGTQAATAKFGDQRTQPNITVMGGDENYTATAGYEISLGRNLNKADVAQNGKVAIIGSEINRLLFNGKNPIGQVIKVGSVPLQVVGVMKEKGSSFGFGGDRMIIMPVTRCRSIYATGSTSFVINVLCPDPISMETSISEATALFRNIRKVGIGEESTFEITRSDNLSSLLIENLSYVSVVATFIAAITLIGAAIGLMNIMLVSVTERTREIGVRKAIGATSAAIRQQFLTEAVVICQVGGALGIALGILIGNLVSYYFELGFMVPWNWMMVAVVLCFVVGLLSGLIPAVKAAKLDPVESLRYE